MLADLTEIIATKLEKKINPTTEAVNTIQHSFQSFKGILESIEKQFDVLREPSACHEGVILQVKQESMGKILELIRFPSSCYVLHSIHQHTHSHTYALIYY